MLLNINVKNFLLIEELNLDLEPGLIAITGETGAGKSMLVSAILYCLGDKNSNAIRLNKYIANSGICSRREADMHISIGSVTVNGKVITEMGFKVLLDDDVRFDGSRVSPEKKA